MGKAILKNLMLSSKFIPPRWLTCIVSIRDFDIIDDAITIIESNAFNTHVFHALHDLTLDMPLEILRNDSFKGLFCLEYLRLRTIKLHAIDVRILCTAAEITALQLVACDLNVTILRNIFECLPQNIEAISIENSNSIHKISKKLFAKFKNISRLSLPDNRIVHIEPNAFDSFARTLRVLNLRNNLLTAMPEGVLPKQFFDDYQTSKKIFVLVNPWHCSRQLENFKKLLLKYPVIFWVKPFCSTPFHLRGKLIESAELYYDTEVSCPLKNILTSSSITKLTIMPHAGTNNFSLTLNSTSSKFNFIWFEAASASGINKIVSTPICISAKGNEFIKLDFTRKLKSNNIYLFCLLNRQEAVANLLDCATIHTARFHVLVHNKQLSVLGILLTICGILAFCIGLVATYISRIIFNKSHKTDNSRLPPLPPRPSLSVSRSSVPDSMENVEYYLEIM